MPTIDARLSAIEESNVRVETVLKRIEENQRKLEENQKKDHDAITTLTVRVETQSKQLESIKQEIKEDKKASSTRSWQIVFILLAAAVSGTVSWFAARIKGS